MKTIKIWNDNPSERQLSEIVRDLEMGHIMIIPTDTIYALACDSLNSKAIERLCSLKGINPEKTNLSIICSDISMAAEYSRIDNKGFSLLKEHTPGPFTFLFRTASTLPRAFKGRKTVGVRIPGCETALAVAGRLGHPLLCSSIEFDDEDYARDPGLIAETYHDKVDMIVEGPDGGSEPSTIIDCTGDAPEVTRQGKGLL